MTTALASSAGLALSSPMFAQTSASAPTLTVDTPRELKPAGADLGTLYQDMLALCADRPFDMSFLGDRFATLPEFLQTARQQVFETLQYRPSAVAPNAEVLERADMGDYIREKILFNTSPQFRVPAYVLIPKGLKKPAPAIIDFHSHGGMFLMGKEKIVDLGLDHPVVKRYHQQNYEGRPTSTELVRRGYVVIAIDAFMFGERRLMLDADLHLGWDRWQYTPEDFVRLSRVCASKESTLAKSMCLAGMTWPGVVFWDDIRTVDYLVTRPEVDPERLGCCGVSMGGYRTIYLAGLDPRIKAASIVGFMSSVRPMLRSHIDTHSWVHFLPELHRHLDLPDVASLMAPRALMVQQCSQDGLFPLGGMQESVEHIANVYAKAKVPEMFVGKFYDRPHMFSIDMQNDAFVWFDKHLS
ncbi:MAG: acetylxylan esterase [Pirellulaceae bacterium]|nr:acetylxylan esterase [Pirellulaceae bacterium]